MKKATKTAIFLAASLILAGIAIIFMTYACVGFDLSQFNIVQYEENTTPVYEDFASVEIEINSVPVNIKRSADGQCRVVAKLDKHTLPAVIVKNANDPAGACLYVSLENRHEHWYDSLSVNLDGTYNEVTLYLPDKQYDRLTATTHSGIIRVEAGIFRTADLTSDSGQIFCSSATVRNLNCKAASGMISLSHIDPAYAIHLEADSGLISLDSCRSKALTASSNSGGITLENTLADYTMTLTTQSGAISLVGVNAPEMALKTHSGSISGSLVTGKQFKTQVGSGHVELPPSSGDETCTVEVNSGLAKLTISE